MAVFKGLAHDLQGLSTELRQLIEKQQSVVRERDFARAGIGAATEQSGVRNRMMRGAIRSRGDKGFFGIEVTSDGVDLGGLDRLFFAHVR